MRTSNKNARGFVQRREPFRANNTYAEVIGGRYVVYSYGAHWPLFVHEGGQWYFNSSKYGTTTSKHHSQLHPLCDGTALPVEKMLELAQFGLTGMLTKHLVGDEVFAEVGDLTPA